MFESKKTQEAGIPGPGRGQEVEADHGLVVAVHRRTLQYAATATTPPDLARGQNQSLDLDPDHNYCS